MPHEGYEDKKGFEVVKEGKKYFINGKYERTKRFFLGLRAGWDLLRKGDEALTRAVKKQGPY